MYPPTIKIEFKLDIVGARTEKNCRKSDLNWVAAARHVLILWENETTSLRIIFEYIPDLRDIILDKKAHGQMRAS